MTVSYAQVVLACNIGGCTGVKTDDTPVDVFFAAVLGIVLLCMVFKAVQTARRRRLLRNGTAATAVILEIEAREVRGGTVDTEVKLSVTEPNGAVFESRTTASFPLTDLPKAGWNVPVRYSQKDTWRVAVAGPAQPPMPPEGEP
ncbi:hypothetical protein [Streptomyces sp. NPDC001250]|uniref:hypothetical protein n=1 Tax=unclassified Streptomyces TaxID=2593676 RepID=UPI00332A32C1